MSNLHQSRKVNHSPLANRKGQTETDSLGLSAIKRAILDAAGITPDTLGAQLHAALEVLNEGLSAEKVQYFTHAGVVTDSRVDIDHNTRLKAAAELASIVTILGDMKNQQHHGVGGGTQITVSVPFLADLKIEQGNEVIEVTPVSQPMASE